MGFLLRFCKSFKRTVKHRTNYLHWVTKQLDLTNVKQVNLENIKNLRYKKRSSRSLSHWNYSELFSTLESAFINQGVLVNKVSAVYTSQRCSCCGWVRKGNRNGKIFKCDRCQYESDSDLNASKNISFGLTPIMDSTRLSKINRKGFYWLRIGQELIVPDALKNNSVEIFQ